jgi:NADPH:quinone reductase-like Zn-dependent oxidoreductase
MTEESPTAQKVTMKAIVYHEYGAPDDVLDLQEVDKPVVKNGEVLVRVHAASVAAGDWHVVTGLPYIVRMMGNGLLKPKNRIPGQDMAGRVEAVGRDAKQFQPGDEVFGEINGGAYAEYVCVSEDDIVPKPANLTFEQAAAVGASAFAALQGLRDQGKLQPGQKVLINGASGGVGTFAVQIAKAFGADVTGVCSTRNVDMVRSIGADQVIDYTQEDFTRNGRYDLMLDVAANRSLSDCRRALTPKGTYVLIGDSGGHWVGGLSRFSKTRVLSPFVSQRMRPLVSMPNKEDLVVLKELLEAGEVTPVIDRRCTLSEVPEALRCFGEGHAQGKTVITV